MTGKEQKPLEGFIIEQGDPAKGDYRFNISLHIQRHSNVGVALGKNRDIDQNWENFDNGRTFTLRTDVMPTKEQMEEVILMMSICGQMMSKEIMSQLEIDRGIIIRQLMNEKEMRDNPQSEGQEPKGAETPKTGGKPPGASQGGSSGQSAGDGKYDPMKMSNDPGSASENQKSTIEFLYKSGGAKAKMIDTYMEGNYIEDINHFSKRGASILISNLKA